MRLPPFSCEAAVIVNRRNIKTAEMNAKVEHPLKDEITEDAKQNEQHNNTDMPWGPGRKGKKYEKMLLRDLVAVFESIDGKAHNNAKYKWLQDHATKPGKGSLDNFGYSTFNKWIRGGRTAQRDINGRILRVFETFMQDHNDKKSL